MTYKVEVIADKSGIWVGNTLEFRTAEEAETYGRDLAWRWTLVREWRVIPTPDLKAAMARKVARGGSAVVGEG